MDPNVKMAITHLTSCVVASYARENGIEVEEAMKLFMTSKTFQQLNNPKTGMWTYGQVAIYDMFMKERTNKQEQ